jgi:hemerythrin
VARKQGDVGRRQALTLGVGTVGGLAMATAAFQLLDGEAPRSQAVAATAVTSPSTTTPSPSVPAAVSLRVGYGEVDGQHEVVIELVDALEWTMTSSAGRPIQKNALTDLVRYVKVHYAFEESLMATYEVAGADVHKQAHEKMLTWVGGFAEKFDRGSATLTPALIQELRHWLEVHITTNDAPMAKELLAKGVRSAV